MIKTYARTICVAGLAVTLAFSGAAHADKADEDLDIETIELDGEYWAVMEGGMLRSTLEAWADFAGWTVVWDSPVDFKFRASATFVGGFEESVGRLVDTIYMSNPELHVTLYMGNRVVHVEEKRATTN